VPRESEDYDLLSALNFLKNRKLIRKGKGDLWELCGIELPQWSIPEADYDLIVEQSIRATENVAHETTLADQLVDDQPSAVVKRIK